MIDGYHTKPMKESGLVKRRLFLRAGIAAGAEAFARTDASGKPEAETANPAGPAGEALRIAFMTDMQFDGPPRHDHMQWDWKDTPDDRWDRKGETENVGFFVDGRKINSEEREYGPHQLPEVHFMESDLAIFEKALTVQLEEDDWFLIPKGGTGTVEFQQQWAEPVEIRGVTVEAEGGTHGNVLYKTSDHPLGDWSDYKAELPKKAASFLRVRIDFEADAKAPMRVRDVKVDTE